MALAAVDVGDHQSCRKNRGDADRQVDEEDRLPAKVGDQKTTESGSGDDGDPGQGAVDAKDRAALLRCEGAQHDRQHLGRHDRAAEALEGAGRDQLGRPVGKPAQHRREGEERGPRQEHRLGPDAIAEAAGGYQEDGVHEGVAVEHPQDLIQGRVQAVDDRRDGDVDDGGVEQGHEETHADHDHHDPGIDTLATGFR